jgi:hypothetical protein
VYLATKYDTGGNQRSWYVILTESGKVILAWSPDGTFASRIFVTSTASVATSGRKAIKIFLDVNNGAGGSTVTFSTADSIGGSYSTLGSPVITAGVTSVFSSTTDVAIGNGPNAASIISNTDAFSGRFHAFELRNSAGTLVAKADFTAQAAGATSWADGLGNTWALGELAPHR